MAGRVRQPWNVLARLVQSTLGVLMSEGQWPVGGISFFVAVGGGGNGLGLSQEEIQRTSLWSPSEGI